MKKDTDLIEKPQPHVEKMRLLKEEPGKPTSDDGFWDDSDSLYLIKKTSWKDGKEKVTWRREVVRYFSAPYGTAKDWYSTLKSASKGLKKVSIGMEVVWDREVIAVEGYCKATPEDIRRGTEYLAAQERAKARAMGLTSALDDAQDAPW